MRSTSGAHIFKLGSRAIKLGTGEVGTRVETQAHYCRKLGSAALPRITRVFRNGYVMESLDPYMPRDSYEFVHDTMFTLAQNVWKHEAEHRTVWSAHYDYIVGRAKMHAPRQAFRVRRAFDELIDVAHPYVEGLTHGDPTLDNVMRRKKTGEVVLIDPLPPYENGEMPQLVAVDAGKIAQSLIGYESIKYERPFFTERVDDMMRMLRNFVAGSPGGCEGDMEWCATLWFMVAHVVRLIPYQPHHRRNEYVQLLDKSLDLSSAFAS